MNPSKIPKIGTTKERKRFWDSTLEVVSSLTKTAGTNVSVREVEGKGTFVNVHRGPTEDEIGSCCIGTGFYYGSCLDGYTRTECEDDPDVQGVWHREACDSGIDCVFACCHDGVCTDETQQHCIDIGGEFQGLHVFCSDDPPPACSLLPVCPEGDVDVDLTDFPSACGCFFVAGSPGTYTTWDFSAIPTTFTMSYDIGIGAWRADFADAIIETTYGFSDSSCSTPDGTFTFDAIAVFSCDPFGSGTYQFFINTNPGSAFITFDSQGSYTGTSVNAPNDRCCFGTMGCTSGGIGTGGTALLSWT